jgi:hypothetical protein
MNSTATSTGPKKAFNWREDLSASRDLSRNEVQAFGFAVGWFEDWRVRMKLPPGRESAREFWKVAVQSKPRQDWQLSQWAVGSGFKEVGGEAATKKIRRDVFGNAALERRLTKLARHGILMQVMAGNAPGAGMGAEGGGGEDVLSCQSVIGGGPLEGENRMGRDAHTDWTRAEECAVGCHTQPAGRRRSPRNCQS